MELARSEHCLGGGGVVGGPVCLMYDKCMLDTGRGEFHFWPDDNDFSLLPAANGALGQV